MNDDTQSSRVMSRPIDASLKQANLLLRTHRYAEAREMLAALVKMRPGFLPYEQGYALACKKISNETTSGSGKANLIVNATHPSSKPVASSRQRVFFVVTPVLNGERFIEKTLESILFQSGNFFIDYYVKDAVSTDGTLDILAACGEKVSSGRLPLRCSGLRFRVDSSEDHGLYDALSGAFKRETWHSIRETIHTYLNADDLMGEGAFAIVAHIFDVLPVRWLTGQVRVIDTDGNLVLTPRFPLSFAREDIAEGLHEGRSLYCIQQEGTFWLHSLYQQAGGVDASLKLAGDYDLWRRFARFSELLAVDRPLASFRSHGTQLSAQIERYYAEVDRVSGRDIRQTVASTVEDKLDFFMGSNFSRARTQRPGPVVFLDEEMNILEVAYLKRGWVGW